MPPHRHLHLEPSPPAQVSPRRSPPAVPSLAIRRPRLEALLDDETGRRVVLVRGPAGAGKTVLLAQWATSRPDRCAWLLLDASDDDPERLLGHLVDAVAQLGVDAEPEVDPGRVDEALLRGLVRQAAVAQGAPVTLVLDAVDAIRARDARQLLRRLVEDPPRGGRLVLLARSKPRVGLERARLRGDLVEIDPAALRFQRAEIVQLVRSWEGQAQDVATLEQATLGWAAGLRLVQLETAGDYVKEELLGGASPALSSFLAVTCWLPHLTPALCAAVAGHGVDPLVARPPELDAVPLLPVASQPGVLRYPPILTEVLQAEYRRWDPEAVGATLRRAADACRRSGELVIAVDLFLQAGDIDAAARACDAMAAHDPARLARLDELLRAHPTPGANGPRWLSWRVRAAAAAGRVAEATQLLVRARAQLAHPAADAADRTDLTMAEAAVAEPLGDTATLLASGGRILASPGPAAVAVQAHGWRVRGLVWSGDAAAAAAEVDALDAAAARGETPAATDAEVALAHAWAAWSIGDITTLRTHLTAAVEARPPALPAGDAVELGGRAAERAVLSGVAHRERDHTVKAMAVLREAGALATAHGHTVVAALASSELARCHRAAGAVLEGLEEVVPTRASSGDLPTAIDLHLRATEVRLRLDRTDHAGARAVARAAPPGVDRDLLLARIAVHETPTRAGELVDRVEPGHGRHAVEQLLLRAQLPDVTPAEASAALSRAAALGEPLGLVRTFLDEAGSLAGAMAVLAGESDDRAVGRITALARQELAMAPAPAAVPLVEQLTTRELAVLRMLPLRMSNREMAAQMYISINTLKTHVRAIYRKLEVPDRSAAVRRAKALELV